MTDQACMSYYFLKKSLSFINEIIIFKIFLRICLLKRYILARDIDKVIHYYSLAANNNDRNAQANLGVIYYVTRDIDKAIHYFQLTANQNDPQAQYNLGLIYYFAINHTKNNKKGRFYIMLASKNGHEDANFSHGFLLHEGKNNDRNIEEAVHYYKEASSLNNRYAKNNLGIIYRHGYGSIEGRAGNAAVYFEEAIRQKNDCLSMYNLAHICMYDETIKQDLDKSINLLVRSSNLFIDSKFYCAYY
ncbi:hypothetical protein M9Y10_043808 [Tritrichomonas musculus]|uniref:Uncharacterized protein n=1 Tax=Tritrichomonas musculus TaxID=1915356 RepID=A0ABR2K0Q8_9EUKA